MGAGPGSLACHNHIASQTTPPRREGEEELCEQQCNQDLRTWNQNFPEFPGFHRECISHLDPRLCESDLHGKLLPAAKSERIRL